jgi:PAT family beta-lactamase induction signal transducer AmpG
MAPRVSADLVSRLGVLGALYFSQGLPFGFFTQAVPVVMRQQGLSLALVGASSVLALPWGLKFLWAPLVDRHGGSALGRRRGWILPLQALTVLGLLALAVVGPLLLGEALTRGGSATAASIAEAVATGLVALAVGMALTNLLAATQDIATDGLAVDILAPAERGLGNGLQVAAYRLGMITGGGALLWLFSRAGWTWTFVAMAALVAAMSVPVWHFREPAVVEVAAAPVSPWAMLRFFRSRRTLLWLGAIALYKVGDAWGSPMARTLLVDLGFGLNDIALLLGTLGSLAGLVGALTGGLLAGRGRLLALLAAGLVHAALMASYALPVLVEGMPTAVVAALIVGEHLTGGMATVALFTAMMDACDRATGASDYTAQASVVVLATGLGGALSGVSAQAWGYAPHFLAAAAVCALGALAMWPLYRRGLVPGAQAPTP